MRNFENNFNNQTNERNTGWESMGDGDFERRRAERANRRHEEMQRLEAARTSMMNKAKALAAAAVLAITIASGVAVSGCSTHEIMDTDRAGKIETISGVELITLTDGPNIRKDPMIPNKEEGSNVIMDFGEEGQVARIPYQGEVYYYQGWYGVSAEEFTDALFSNAFINSKEAEKIVKKDGDGTIWISADYMRIDKKEMTQY